MNRVRTHHWMVAGTAALGLHAAVGLWVLRSPPTTAASPGGGGSVEVMLAPAAGPSGAPSPVGPRQDAQQVTPDAAVAPAAPPVETVARPTAEAVEVPKAEAVPETSPPVTPPTAADAVPTPQPERPEAVAPPKPELAATAVPEPLAARPPEPEAVAVQEVVPPPRPQPRPEVPKREATRPAPPAPVRKPEAEPVPAAGAAPPSGAASAAAETQGRTSSQSTGGQPSPAARQGAAEPAPAPGGAADYMSALRAWLERHKEYPPQARRRRVEGTALLVFVMDRQGKVLSHRIERGAGDPSLDRAVIEMIERAQPLPAMPESFPQARLEVRVPVQFLLR